MGRLLERKYWRWRSAIAVILVGIGLYAISLQHRYMCLIRSGYGVDLVHGAVEVTWWDPKQHAAKLLPIGISYDRVRLGVSLAPRVNFGFLFKGFLVPLWIPMVFLLSIDIFRQRQRRRSDLGHSCKNCGYDLQGVSGGKCPECGLDVSSDKPMV